MISEIIEKLPSPMKGLVKAAKDYCKYKVVETEMVKDLAEYFDLSLEETICMLKVSKRINADLWRILDPKSEDEIFQFYRVTPYEIFDTAYWHMSRYQRKLRSEIVKISYGEVLDYGGGIGDLSVMLAQKGLNVTYLEIPGKTFEFAKWLFKKRQVLDKVQMIPADELDKLEYYDTIICLDVIEHVADQIYVLEKLGEHLNKNGILIITNLCDLEKDEDLPMEFEVDFDAEKFLNDMGIYKMNKNFNYLKDEWVWIKK